MIPQRIQRLFDFIDYLNENKDEFKKYIPLCNELRELSIQKNLLNPDTNYKDKLRYDELHTLISEKFEPITTHIYGPITNKLRELDIWSGDGAYASIWNNNISAIYEFRSNFTQEEVIEAIKYKRKYLDFRTETNTDFLSLYSIFKGLDEILKVLFDFFKDTENNEFESFEAKKIKVNSIQEALKISLEQGRSISFSLPEEDVLSQNNPASLNDTINIYNKIVMGDHTEIGSISNNSGNISVGNFIKTEGNNNTIISDIRRSKVHIGDSNSIQKKGIDYWTIGSVIIAFITLLVAVIVDWDKIFNFF